MDTEKVTNKYGSYTDYDCYNVFNDDVVNGIISNNNGYTYYSSAYYAGDKISLSKEAAEKLAEIAGVDVQAHAEEMFKAGSDLASKTPEEIFLHRL